MSSHIARPAARDVSWFQVLGIRRYLATCPKCQNERDLTLTMIELSAIGIAATRILGYGITKAQ